MRFYQGLLHTSKLSFVALACLFGSNAYGAETGNATGYEVNIDGGTHSYTGIYGNESTKTVGSSENKGSVVIKNSNITITGTEGQRIVGIFNADNAQNGSVWIENSTITNGAIYGAITTNNTWIGGTTANYNSVYIKDTTVTGRTWIGGGTADKDSVDTIASYNRVTLVNVNINSTNPNQAAVFGAEPGSAANKGTGQYNTIDFGGGRITGTIFGTHPVGANDAVNSDPNLTIGNTLNIGIYDPRTGKMDSVNSKMEAGNIANFEFLNFYLADINTFKNTTDGVLNLTKNQETIMTMAKVGKVRLNDITGLQASDHIILVHKVDPDPTNTFRIGDEIFANVEVTGLVGFTTATGLENGDHDIVLRFNKPMVVTPMPQSQALLSPRVNEMLVLKEGMQSFLGTLDTLVPVERKPLFTFGNVNVYKRYYDQVSDTDLKGLIAHMGIGSMTDNKYGDFTVGLFGEYGNGSYHGTMSQDTRLNGKAYYFGMGSFVKQQNINGFYAEASIRGGWMDNKYDGVLADIERDVKLSGNYFGVHAGFGKLINAGKNNQINAYAKYFYTRTYNDDTELSGVKINFSAMDSSLLKLGLRDSYEFKQNHKLYLGGIYDYEFKGAAQGNMEILGYKGNIKPIETKGGTPAVEAGYVFENAFFKLDLSAKKYFGKYKGHSANLRYRIDF